MDIIVEDGRDYLVYFKYSSLIFPKIVSKIIPFAVFFSFYYVINKYEINNELMIFGTLVLKNSTSKFYNSLFYIINDISTSNYYFLVPETQNMSRSLIRNSNVDFIDSFVKPRKFNDNINGLTIYAEEKLNNGELKNLYLKKNENRQDFQITIARKGEFKNTGNTQLLILYDGQTINKKNNKITNFYFSKSDFNLSAVSTDVVTDDKLQETRTKNHIDCLKKYFKKDLSFNKKQKNYINHNCSKDSLDNLFQELYKRLIVPMFIPLLILFSLFLIIFSKKNKFYNKSRLLIFFTGIILIILSETMLRFINNDFISNLKFIFTPILIFFIFYITFRILIKTNISYRIK